MCAFEVWSALGVLGGAHKRPVNRLQIHRMTAGPFGPWVDFGLAEGWPDGPASLQTFVRPLGRTLEWTSRLHGLDFR